MKKITDLLKEDELNFTRIIKSLENFSFDFTDSACRFSDSNKINLATLLSRLFTYLEIYKVDYFYYANNSYSPSFASLYNNVCNFSGGLFIKYGYKSGYVILFDFTKNVFEIKFGIIEKSLKPDIPNIDRDRQPTLDSFVSHYLFGYSGFNVREYIEHWFRHIGVYK